MQKVKAGLNEYARPICAKNNPKQLFRQSLFRVLRKLMKNQVTGSSKRQLSGFMQNSL